MAKPIRNPTTTYQTYPKRTIAEIRSAFIPDFQNYLVGRLIFIYPSFRDFRKSTFCANIEKYTFHFLQSV
jgi:hypothetical protein